MNLADRFFRSIISLSDVSHDSRPFIASRKIRLSYGRNSIEPRANNILIDTGATQCTVDRFTVADLAGLDQFLLEDYLEKLSLEPPPTQGRQYQTSIIYIEPPFSMPIYMRSFGGTGSWGVYIENAEIIIAKSYRFRVNLYTALHSKTILGMSFLEQVKLVLDREKERAIVLF